MKKNLLILALCSISSTLLAEGYSTNMQVQAEPEEIFEDVQMNFEGGISDYDLKEKFQKTENAVEFFQNERTLYISGEYYQLQKDGSKKDKKEQDFDFRDKNRDYVNAQVFYQPKDENYLIGYEYKMIGKIRDIHSLILGYTSKDNHFFINPYIQENKTDVLAWNKGKTEKEKIKKTESGVNFQTYLKMPIMFTERLYATVDFNFVGSDRKELGIGFYAPKTIEILEDMNVDLIMKAKYFKSINSNKTDNLIEEHRIEAKIEPTFNFTKNIFLKTEAGYTWKKFEGKDTRNKSEFSIGVGIGFKF